MPQKPMMKKKSMTMMICGKKGGKIKYGVKLYKDADSAGINFL
jgi:hypothetical protein